MDSNPYQSPAETPPLKTAREKRPFNFPRLILVASLIAALTLVFFEAPRWLIAMAGASAVLAAEEMLRKP